MTVISQPSSTRATAMGARGCGAAVAFAVGCWGFDTLPSSRSSGRRRFVHRFAAVSEGFSMSVMARCW